jgi:hypothetical protein
MSSNAKTAKNQDDKDIKIGDTVSCYGNDKERERARARYEVVGKVTKIEDNYNNRYKPGHPLFKVLTIAYGTTTSSGSQTVPAKYCKLVPHGVLADDKAPAAATASAPAPGAATASAPAPGAATKTARLTVKNVKEGLDGGVILEKSDGTTIELKKGDWIKVKSPEGKEELMGGKYSYGKINGFRGVRFPPQNGNINGLFFFRLRPDKKELGSQYELNSNYPMEFGGLDGIEKIEPLATIDDMQALRREGEKFTPDTQKKLQWMVADMDEFMALYALLNLSPNVKEAAFLNIVGRLKGDIIEFTEKLKKRLATPAAPAAAPSERTRKRRDRKARRTRKN